jgi:hypothetical protein
MPPAETPPFSLPCACAVAFARQTQPTLEAMITTESSDIPIPAQWFEQVAAASLGTLIVAFVPTFA